MRALWHSPTLRTASIYAASGIGFAGANLILARILPTAEYGLFTLVIALTTLGYSLAPAGIDGMVNRRRLAMDTVMLQRTLLSGSLVGIGLVLVGWLGYQLSPTLLLIVLVSTVAGGAMAVAGAQFQSERRFSVSLAVTQAPNLTLLIAALAVLLSGRRSALLPLIISALGFLVAGFCGWLVLFRERARKPVDESWFSWREAISLAGIGASGLLLVQLDRLIIPHVLTVADLATYGVLAAIAGSFYRVLQMGVGYTLFPRLRAASTVVERRRLLAHEARLVGALVVVGSILVWLITPPIERWLLEGKYDLGGPLLLAVIVSGMAKIMNAFARSTVSALATPSELSLVNILGWASVALAVPVAIFGARWGLTGVIYAVGLGWFFRAVTSLFLSLRHLRLPASVPITAP